MNEILKRDLDVSVQVDRKAEVPYIKIFTPVKDWDEMVAVRRKLIDPEARVRQQKYDKLVFERYSLWEKLLREDPKDVPSSLRFEFEVLLKTLGVLDKNWEKKR